MMMHVLLQPIMRHGEEVMGNFLNINFTLSSDIKRSWSQSVKCTLITANKEQILDLKIQTVTPSHSGEPENIKVSGVPLFVHCSHPCV